MKSRGSKAKKNKTTFMKRRLAAEVVVARRNHSPMQFVEAWMNREQDFLAGKKTDETVANPNVEIATVSSEDKVSPVKFSEMEEAFLSGAKDQLNDGWTYPGPSNSEIVKDGFYRGRFQVGEVGGMLRVLPRVGTRLSGSHVPDSVVEAGVLSPSISVGAVSIKGASHHNGDGLSPRQDSYTVGKNANWIVFCVADGVSSGSLSHVAATEASKTGVWETLNALKQNDPGMIDWEIVGEAIRESVRSLGLRLAYRQVGDLVPLPEVTDTDIAKIMSTTCELLVSPTERRNGVLRVYRIRITGDGSFYILDRELGWNRIGAQKFSDSQLINNAVSNPLPMHGAPPQIDTWDLRPGQAAVLCTDGFGDVIGRGSLPPGRFLFEQWQNPRDTVGLLSSASFININADDDRTAAIVWATD